MSQHRLQQEPGCSFVNSRLQLPCVGKVTSAVLRVLYLAAFPAVALCMHHTRALCMPLFSMLFRCAPAATFGDATCSMQEGEGTAVTFWCQLQSMSADGSRGPRQVTITLEFQPTAAALRTAIAARFVPPDPSVNPEWYESNPDNDMTATCLEVVSVVAAGLRKRWLCLNVSGR